jgi:hypothetical protein
MHKEEHKRETSGDVEDRGTQRLREAPTRHQRTGEEARESQVIGQIGTSQGVSHPYNSP